MNKKLLIALTFLSLLTLPTFQVLAINKDSKAPTQGLAKSGNKHLYLFEKDADEEWAIVDDPKWGKMNVNNHKNTFVFNAHGLEPEADFDLICYLDPWPGDGSILLGTGTSNANGNLHLKGEIDIDQLHEAALAKLENYLEDPEAAILGEGSKIWLVPAADFDEDNQVMVGWNPADILFEFNLLTQEPIED